MYKKEFEQGIRKQKTPGVVRFVVICSIAWIGRILFVATVLCTSAKEDGDGEDRSRTILSSKCYADGKRNVWIEVVGVEGIRFRA